LAALMAALVGGTLALPASSKTGPLAHAAKCKKAKKGKKKKKKKCKPAGPSGTSLPGQATHPSVTPPVVPAALSVNAIGVTDNTVLSGDSTTGQVTLSGQAPSGGQSVDLQSSDTSVTLVPATVVVAAGQTTAPFSVNTTQGQTAAATLTASSGSSNATTQLTVVNTPSVASVALEKECFTAPGTFSANRVTLDVPAPADTSVLLQSDAPLDLGVPPSVLVPSGSKTAFFDANALQPNPLVKVTATLGQSAQDTAAVNSSPPAPAVTDLSLDPTSVTVGGTSQGTVTLNCEAPTDIVVNLSSDAPGVATPAASTVTILQGQVSSDPFTITTSSSGTANIGASTSNVGPPQQQVPLQVNSLGT
jgi:hypothetical protein